MDTTPLSPGNAQSVFRISELVRLIAEYSDEGTIYSLVCTCQLFFERFVPLLWESIEDLGQLLALFPGIETEEYSEDERVLITFPTLLPSDFARFRLYAPHVKHVEVFNFKYSRGYTMINSESASLLWRDILYLPNLRSLALTKRPSMSCEAHFEIPWLVSLIRPSLQVFKTAMFDTQRPPIISLLDASLLLRTLANTSFDLRSLEIYPAQRQSSRLQDLQTSTQLEETEEGLECLRFLSGLEALQSISTTVSALRRTGLDVLSRLPKLEGLELILLDEDFERAHLDLVLPLDGFPHVRHLALHRQPSLQFFYSIWGLGALVAKLTSVKLRFDRYRRSQFMDWDILSGLVTTLLENSPCINDLELHPPFEGDGTEMAAIMFTLLSQLPLEKLCFSSVIPGLLRIDHQPTEYPLLRKLELPKSSIEPSDLRRLAESLPSLEYLSVHLIAPPGQYNNGNEEASTLLQSIILEVISVYLPEEPEDRVTKEREIEAFFFCLWPNVRFIRSSRDTPERDYNARWIPPLLA